MKERFQILLAETARDHNKRINADLVGSPPSGLSVALANKIDLNFHLYMMVKLKCLKSSLIEGLNNAL